MKPGIYPNGEISNEAYHGGPGISNSGLRLIAEKSPFHYWAKYLSPERPEDSKSSRAQFLGTALHAATLEQEGFKASYVVNPYDDRRGNRYKDLQATAAADGKAVISQAEFDRIKHMRAALLAHPVASALLDSIEQVETSIFAEDPATGALVKCRPDLITASGIIVDLKTTSDGSRDGFSKSCANYGYFQQDPFYSDVYQMATGKPPRAFVFVAVESDYPYAVSTYCMAEEDRQRGRMLYRRALEAYAQCLESGDWPSYSDKLEKIELPEWQRMRLPMPE